MIDVIRYNLAMSTSGIFTRMKVRVNSISQRAKSFPIFLTLVLFSGLLLSAPVRSAKDLANDLWSIHSFDSTSAIGTYFLKQEAYFSVDKFLRQVGLERELGPEWNKYDPWWRQAEEALIERVEPGLIDDYRNYEWIRADWTLIVEDKFNDQDIERLIKHFKTNIGLKQASLIDHSIARQVMMSLTFSGKLKSPLKHLNDDLQLMQEIYHRENAAMQFVTTDLEGAEAQAFALSRLGKEYFTTLIISVTGRINQELDHLSSASETLTLEHAQAIDPYVASFLQDY